MLDETRSLSNKSKITVDSEKLADFSQNLVSFYMRYSSFVSRFLLRSSL
jgi:hypothetical protein